VQQLKAPRRPHRFAAASASATSSTSPPTILEATLNGLENTPNDLEAMPTDGTLSCQLIMVMCRRVLSHNHFNRNKRTTRVAHHGGLLDCQAFKGVVHRLDCAHHCGRHNFIPWRRRMCPWYNTRTSRSDHCWRNRSRSRQVAEACTEFRRHLGCSAGAGKRTNHRGYG